MYNQEKLEDRVKIGNAKEDIIISFNLSDITPEIISNLLNNLQHIVHQYEPGKYSYSNIEIDIKDKINTISDKITILNPPVKEEHRYLIY